MLRLRLHQLPRSLLPSSTTSNRARRTAHTAASIRPRLVLPLLPPVSHPRPCRPHPSLKRLLTPRTRARLGRHHSMLRLRLHQLPPRSLLPSSTTPNRARRTAHPADSLRPRLVLPLLPPVSHPRPC